MNTVERIEAAIQKLEALKGASTPAPWNVFFLDWRLIVQGEPVDDDAEIILDVSRNGGPADGELVVTLHRTIDAQLDFLRFARGFYGARITGPESSTIFAEYGLELADAILGDPS